MHIQSGFIPLVLVAFALSLLTSCVHGRYRHMGYVAIPEQEDENSTNTTIAPTNSSSSTEITAVAQSSGRQAPYSYYYIGRKLWYIPLYFSLYFVCYVGALIIRAIARHKVTFPERLPQQARSARADEETLEVTQRVHEALDRGFMR